MKKILSLLFLPLTAISQKNYPALLDAYMQSAALVNHFNGTVLVANGAKIIYQKSFGYQDVAGTQLLDDTSMFETGVVTEQFTAAAILLLKEYGKLSITDPVTKYFSSFPYPGITLQHLLAHTSGVPDYYEVMKDTWKDSSPATNDDMIRYMEKLKPALYFESGSAYSDCPSDYALLASVIEKVSGQRYEDFMQQNIFNPLQLHHTKVIKGLHVYPQNYRWHTEGIVFDKQNKPLRGDDLVKNDPAFPNLYPIIDGIVGSLGISSSAGDLFAWSRALKENKLLSPASQKEMFTAYSLKDTASKIYNGYGTLVGTNEIGDYVLCREMGNITVGYHVSFIRYAKADNTIVVCANKALNSAMLSGTLAYILYDRDVVPLYVHKPISLDSNVLKKFVGKYEVPNPAEVVMKNGKLYMHYVEQPWEEDQLMLPESPDKIFLATFEDDTQIEFVNDSSGKMQKVFLISKGLRKEIKKL